MYRVGCSLGRLVWRYVICIVLVLVGENFFIEDALVGHIEIEDRMLGFIEMLLIEIMFLL